MSTDTDTDAYLRRVREERARKDEFFGEHPRSPIPQTARSDFDGLRYFDPDPSYRFEATLHEHDDPERITVETTTDGAREYDTVGEFRIAVDGDDVTLQAFRSPGDDHRLWVPFRDATGGEETYPAGRYLDLEAPDDRTADGDWVLDFNEAYNPYCAYSAAYECPLVPVDNWLDVAIRAGERLPDL
ncbi:DUF1684 domain-containing protein [Halobaculum lipolyticum]|uniref:DUF1684 domain-containing protein n=1 Tax=Halobaculum lipolyticum TaxID=3032001 RepID=A0ABD5W5Y3_9EURY|nr:DUF1684 domain-containing protein [Halobaculum sp. DT31]